MAFSRLKLGFESRWEHKLAVFKKYYKKTLVARKQRARYANQSSPVFSSGCHSIFGIKSAAIFKPKFVDQDPNDEKFSVKDLELAEGLTIERLTYRMELLKDIDLLKLEAVRAFEIS